MDHLSVEEVELELSLERWVGFSANQKREIRRELTSDGIMSEVTLYHLPFSRISFASFFCLHKMS